MVILSILQLDQLFSGILRLLDKCTFNFDDSVDFFFFIRF